MNIQEVYNQLQNCLDKLESSSIDDIAKIDLEILVSQLKKQLLIGAFDPIKELDQITVADVSKLPELINQVSGVIKIEKDRVNLVNKIISIAKMGLNAAGLHLS